MRKPSPIPSPTVSPKSPIPSPTFFTMTPGKPTAEKIKITPRNTTTTTEKIERTPRPKKKINIGKIVKNVGEGIGDFGETVGEGIGDGLRTTGRAIGHVFSRRGAIGSLFGCKTCYGK